MSFFLEGGVPGLITLALGILSVGVGLRFARHPHERGVGVVRCLSLAMIFTIIASTASAIRVVLGAASAHGDDAATLVMAGLSESMMPPIAGFSLLAISWMLFALGARRLPEF